MGTKFYRISQLIKKSMGKKSKGEMSVESASKNNDALGVKKFSLYLMDYGAPVGFRIAAKYPQRVQTLIIQNGNAYEEGLCEFWDPIKKYWKDKTSENAKPLATADCPNDTETKLKRIAWLSSRDGNKVFDCLMHHCNEPSLRKCYNELEGKKAVGHDGIDKAQYGEELEHNLQALVIRMKQMAYRPGAAPWQSHSTWSVFYNNYIVIYDRLF